MPQAKAILMIGEGPKGETVVSGDLDKKDLILKHIAMAIKIIVDFQPSRVIKPKFLIPGGK